MAARKEDVSVQTQNIKKNKKDNRRQQQMILRHFKKAIKASKCPRSIFKIVPASGDSIDLFYIMFETQGGLYSGQKHILHFQTKYGRGADTMHYPTDPPLVKFITKIYHPNVYTSGSICVDIFTNAGKWSPQVSIENMVSCIVLLLDEPNVNSPANGKSAVLYKKCVNLVKEMQNQCVDAKEKIKMKDACFQAFKDETSNEYAKNNLSAYYEYFPTLKEQNDEKKIENSMKKLAI
jgi:ubiquitin-protein ligase